MTTVSLHDDIRFEIRPDPNKQGAEVSLACETPGIPTDATNLVWRAIELLRPNASVRAQLVKRIPAGGGLGGGSSNAAATLQFLTQRLGLTNRPLYELARQLGSDVPFFLGPPSSLAQSRGEQLTPVDAPTHATWAVLMLHRKITINTAACYRRLDALRPLAPPGTLDVPDMAVLARLPVDELLATLINDLEAPAFSMSPELGELRQQLQAAARRVVRMSGSGSTLFTLAASQADANDVIARLRHHASAQNLHFVACELARHRNGVVGEILTPDRAFSGPGGKS